MARSFLAASTLSTAVGLAMGLQALAASADEAANKDMDKEKMHQTVQANMARAKAKNLEKCYGINAVGKNDCSEGPHSCAGQATEARESKSFVLVPAGDCLKIEGGKLKAS
ncbi:MAG TPA: DUF2282 domain-containing protein [Burkholderiaceae bacterium]|nr:DUF2282 domain-containing protein [Burkholderiaceae bacterium]